MARGSSKGLHRLVMVNELLDNHISGPFSVADLIDTWKSQGVRRIPTSRELGNIMKKFMREGRIVSVGEAVPLIARMMQEQAGLTQGYARKIALYIKVEDLAMLESELDELDDEEE